MLAKFITLNAASLTAAPAAPQVITEFPVKEVLGLSSNGQHILVEVNVDETSVDENDKPLKVPCTWFAAVRGQAMPNQTGRVGEVLVNGVKNYVRATCIN